MQTITDQSHADGSSKSANVVEQVVFVQTEETAHGGSSTLLHDIGVRQALSHDINTMLSRPTQIAQYNFSDFPSPNFLSGLDWFGTFLNIPTVKRKWWNIHNLRCTMVARITVSTAAYSYGQIGVAANLNYQLHTGTPAFATNIQYIRNRSRDYVTVDIGAPLSTELRVPYTSSFPYYDLHKAAELASINPKFDLFLLSPLLRSDTGATAVGKVTVLFWLEDVELATPVPLEYQSKREQKGPVSSVATTIASIAKPLSSVPVIGPFASAVDIGSSAIAQIAKMFGYSKPKDLEERTTIGYTSRSSYSSKDQFKTLTLDPNQGVAINEDVLNEVVDPLSFEKFLGHWGATNFVEWPTTLPSGNELLAWNVSPGAVLSRGSAPYEVMPTPLYYGSLGFSYWRGSLVYRITFIASKYHRGKVRIWYSPLYASQLSPVSEISNSAFSTIVDVTSTTTIEITVTWNVNRSYLQTALTRYSSDTDDTMDLTSNGYLNITVVEPLIAPNTAASAYVVVDVKAGDDYELACPTTYYMEMYHRTPQNQSGVIVDSSYANGLLTNYTTTPAPISARRFEPEYVSLQSDRIQLQSAVEPSSIELRQVNYTRMTFGDSQYAPKPNPIFMGEKFMSFRPLMKRMTLSRQLPYMINDRSKLYTAISWNPIEPGNRYKLGTTTTIDPMTWWTYLQWYSVPFHCLRGSVRVDVDFHPNDETQDGHYQVMSLVEVAKAWDYQFASGTCAAGMTGSQTGLLPTFSMEGKGTERYNPIVGQQVSFSIPYQSVNSYLTNYLPTSDLIYPSARLILTNNASAPSDGGFKISYAAGEDYQVGFWWGVPLLYPYVSGAISAGFAEGAEPLPEDNGDAMVTPEDFRSEMSKVSKYRDSYPGYIHNDSI